MGKKDVVIEQESSEVEQEYHFPTLEVSVRAKSLEEATEKAKHMIK